MSLYKYLRESWANNAALQKQRMITWRKEPVLIRLEHPTRLDRARSLGFKAKQGIFVVRVRLDRGGRMRPTIRSGRRSKTSRRKLILEMNYQHIAERRANDRYVNCEVLNSYLVGKDGIHIWHEVIMVDPEHPAIRNDPHLNWIGRGANVGRTYRGLTRSGRKSRGLLHKGFGSEKTRTSGTRIRKARRLHP